MSDERDGHMYDIQEAHEHNHQAAEHVARGIELVRQAQDTRADAVVAVHFKVCVS